MIDRVLRSRAHVCVFNNTRTTEIYTYGHTLSLHDALPIWPARLRPRARQPLAAEGLRSHHRADHRAVDVEIADMRVRLGHLGGARDAAVEPHRQPEAFFIDAPDRLDQLARRPGGVMEDRAEPFLFQLLDQIGRAHV